MKPASAKKKGREFQNHVRRILLETYPQLEDDDIKTAIMGESGEDLKLSPAARKLIGLSIECKKRERLTIWEALKQAEANGKNGAKPAVIFARNRSKPYIALALEDYLELVTS